MVWWITLKLPKMARACRITHNWFSASSRDTEKLGTVKSLGHENSQKAWQDKIEWNILFPPKNVDPIFWRILRFKLKYLLFSTRKLNYAFSLKHLTKQRQLFLRRKILIKMSILIEINSIYAYTGLVSESTIGWNDK